MPKKKKTSCPSKGSKVKIDGKQYTIKSTHGKKTDFTKAQKRAKSGGAKSARMVKCGGRYLLATRG